MTPLLHTLEREPASWAELREPGCVALPEATFTWNHLHLEIQHHNDPPRLVPEGEIALQLSRSMREQPHNWLSRLVRRNLESDAWLHAEIRIQNRERIRVSAPIDDPTLLHGLLDLEHPGAETDAHTLLSLLTTLRGFGARVLDVARKPSPPEGRVASFVARLGITLPTGCGETRIVTSSVALRDALHNPPHDGIIHLARGRYELLEATTLRGPLILSGETAEDTRIFISRSTGALTAALAPAAIWLRDLTLTGARISNSTLVLAQPGAGLVLERCRIYGADDTGIEVRSQAMLYARNCDISHNLRSAVRVEPSGRAFLHDTRIGREDVGITSEADADLTLLGCTLTRCDTAAALSGTLHIEDATLSHNRVGLHITGVTTRAQIRESTLDHQRDVAIHIQHASATLYETVCRDGHTGLRLENPAEGTRIDADCLFTTLTTGIHLRGGRATLRDVTCTRCDVGIHVTDVIHAHIHTNTCSENRVGLLIEDTTDVRFAAPHGHLRVGSNTLTHNREHGGLIRGAARGRLEHNTASHNTHGITVRDNAIFEIDGNTCHHNRRDGITIEGLAGGAILRNDCGNNAHANIRVDQDRRAAPIGVEDNVCVASRYGLRLEGYTRATVGPNALEGNHRRGLHIGPDARPDLDPSLKD